MTAVYRKKWIIHVERIQREKAQGTIVPLGLNASKVVITKIKLDKDRLNLLSRKSDGKSQTKSDATMTDA